MSEPLLARRGARRRARVAALPRVAPVYRAMPQVREVIELPFRMAGSTGRRRRIAANGAAASDAAYVLPNSAQGRAAPGSGIPPAGDLAKGAGAAEPATGLTPGRPPMVAFYSGAGRRPRAASARASAFARGGERRSAIGVARAATGLSRPAPNTPPNAGRPATTP